MTKLTVIDPTYVLVTIIVFMYFTVVHVTVVEAVRTTAN